MASRRLKLKWFFEVSIWFQAVAESHRRMLPTVPRGQLGPMGSESVIPKKAFEILGALAASAPAAGSRLTARTVAIASTTARVAWTGVLNALVTDLPDWLRWQDGCRVRDPRSADQHRAVVDLQRRPALEACLDTVQAGPT